MRHPSRTWGMTDLSEVKGALCQGGVEGLEGWGGVQGSEVELSDPQTKGELTIGKPKAVPSSKPLEDPRGWRETVEAGQRNWMALVEREEEGEGCWVGPSSTKKTWSWVEPMATKTTWDWAELAEMKMTWNWAEPAEAKMTWDCTGPAET